MGIVRLGAILRPQNEAIELRLARGVDFVGEDERGLKPAHLQHVAMRQTLVIAHVPDDARSAVCKRPARRNATRLGGAKGQSSEKDSCK